MHCPNLSFLISKKTQIKKQMFVCKNGKVYHRPSFGTHGLCVKGDNYILQNKEFQLKVYAMLRNISGKGVTLYLEGRPATPEEIASRCVQEENSYMADYVLDDDGELKELRYDKVIEP